MTNVEDLKKTRTGMRGWAKQAANALEKVLLEVESRATLPADLPRVQDGVRELEKRIANLDTAEENYAMALEEEKMMAEIEASAAIREKLREPLVRATVFVQGQSTITASASQPSGSSASGVEGNEASSSGHGSAGSQVGVVEAKLPRLDLPTFTGDCMAWQSFYEQFEAVIHHSDLPAISKFSYLQSVLAKDAKAAISGLPLTAANYQTALDLLRQRFGREERIINAHVQELLRVEPPKVP